LLVLRITGSDPNRTLGQLAGARFVGTIGKTRKSQAWYAPGAPGFCRRYYLLAEYFTARNGIEKNSAKIGRYPLASCCSFTTPKTYLMLAKDGNLDAIFW
jgi:hypothetical protein